MKLKNALLIILIFGVTISRSQEIRKSESGNPIYIYSEKESSGEFEPVNSDAKLIEDISNPIEQKIDSLDVVSHEIVTEIVYIDVNWIKPSKNRPYHTLITSGISEKPMNVPDDFEEYKFIELLILLPESWNLSQEAFKDEENYWPIRLLKSSAKFPHEYNTWLFDGHTISNGNPPVPYSKKTSFNTSLPLPSLSLGEDFFKLEIDGDRSIYFFCLIPLYPEEVDYKMKYGLKKLLEKFDEYNISDVCGFKPQECL